MTYNQIIQELEARSIGDYTPHHPELKDGIIIINKGIAFGHSYSWKACAWFIDTTNISETDKIKFLTTKLYE